MRRLLTTCFFLLLFLVIHAQELTVKRMEVAVGDLTASVHPRVDGKGEPCALVRVILDDSNPKFEGNVIGDVTKDGLQYMVYMSAESTQLRVLLSDNRSLSILFSDYAIAQLDGKVTYNVIIGETIVHESYEGLKKEETFRVKGVKFKMIRVEGGSFMMGCTPEQNQLDSDREKPVHQVTLSTFYIGETEVTQELWKAVMGKNPSYYLDDGKNLPVEGVNWSECQLFLKRLSELTGRSFRLPTEAEWEYAARGGNKSKHYRYSGSNELDDVGWCWENSPTKKKLASTHPVKQKKPNELGLYDMSGNVREWCLDWYSPYDSLAVHDPIGVGPSYYKISRGGGYDEWRRYKRSFFVCGRGTSSPDMKFSSQGLRLVF